VIVTAAPLAAVPTVFVSDSGVQMLVRLVTGATVTVVREALRASSVASGWVLPIW
jgi:hypothetical protein